MFTISKDGVFRHSENLGSSEMYQKFMEPQVHLHEKKTLYKNKNMVKGVQIQDDYKKQLFGNY